MSSLILSIHTNKQDKKEKSFSVEYTTSSKFQNDKVNFEDDDYYILLDGIVLNKKVLFENCHNISWAEYLVNSYKKLGADFFKNLKGSYYGFLFDKNKNKWIVFSDHISSKPIFFYEGADKIVFSNNYTELIEYLKNNGATVTLNEQGAYLLLSYGYVFEDITITNEIKRLMVGYYVKVQNTKITRHKFFQLRNEPIEISEEDAIEQIDIRFREAVKLAFEKDKEYGYKHIACLSGGLDSRMTVWVANDMGYNNQLNLTFSQSNYLDETIAKQIAADLKHEWLFKALDNGNFLKNIDETTRISGGNVLYYGLAHALSLYDYVNFDNLGIIHSGQLAFALSGLHYSSLDTNIKGKIGDGAYSNSLLGRLNLNFKEDYENEEILKAYIRGFYGTNQGNSSEQLFSETYSPFYDIDFMEFALTIPIKLRYKHNLYKKWIIKKYPGAAKYVWEADKVPINYPYWIKVKGRKIPLKQIPLIVLSRMGYKKYGTSTINHMNPLKYWYDTNNDLKKYLDTYFENHIHLLDSYPELSKQCIKLYKESRRTENIQVLSLLSAVKKIYQ